MKTISQPGEAIHQKSLRIFQQHFRPGHVVPVSIAKTFATLWHGLYG
jgi:hypothetical protein